MLWDGKIVITESWQWIHDVHVKGCQILSVCVPVPSGEDASDYCIKLAKFTVQ